ncbi:MAG TPA: hypothetical protein VFO45_01635 [Sphingomicrobium sp.]|nr:hypothetical protein [Sphingomicrobium sp.]
METDIRYYRRRACEEFNAASRAVTQAARERRMHLVGLYLEHLKALNAPSPLDDQQLANMLEHPGGPASRRPVFGWSGIRAKAEHA